LKSEHARVAADLSAQKDAEVSSKKELIASHLASIESLTSTKDAALADAESRAHERESELQSEIQKLTDAVGKAQAQFIVLTPFPRPHGVF
jgi:DNA repair exonuclease SbcCD ATPase subunit